MSMGYDAGDDAEFLLVDDLPLRQYTGLGLGLLLRVLARNPPCEIVQSCLKTQ
jgi:hypothetical protein